MKRVGDLKEQIMSLDNLYYAYYKASMGKKCNQEARQFAEQFDENIHTLRNDLMDSSLHLGQY